MKNVIYVLEPNLDGRKELSQIFPMKKFIIKFYSKTDLILNDIQAQVPHFVLINLESSSTSVQSDLNSILNHLPRETFVIGLHSKEPDLILKKYTKFSLTDVWQTPIVGVKVLPRVKALSEEIVPMTLELASPKRLLSVVGAKILAMGEAEFILEAPVSSGVGRRLSVKSELIEQVLKTSKEYIVSENRNAHLFDSKKVMTITMLGLSNSDLQKIRAKILHWEKL
jgi:hypothetical protein